MINLSYLDGLRNCILFEPSVNGTDIEFTLIDACSGKLITGLTESGVFRTKTDGTVDNAVSIVESSEGVYMATFGDTISSGDQVFVKDQELWVESEVFIYEIPPYVLTVGVSGSTIGFNNGSGFGDLQPRGFEGVDFIQLSFRISDYEILSAAQGLADGILEFYFRALDKSYQVEFNFGFSQNSFADLDLITYLQSNLGNEVLIDITRIS